MLSLNKLILDFYYFLLFFFSSGILYLFFNVILRIKYLSGLVLYLLSVWCLAGWVYVLDNNDWMFSEFIGILDIEIFEELDDELREFIEHLYYLSTATGSIWEHGLWLLRVVLVFHVLLFPIFYLEAVFQGKKDFFEVVEYPFVHWFWISAILYAGLRLFNRFEYPQIVTFVYLFILILIFYHQKMKRNF